MNRHRMWWLGSCAAGLALAAGCSSPRQASEEPVNSGLGAIAPEQGAEPGDVERMLADTERLFDDLLTARAGLGDASSENRARPTPVIDPAPEPVVVPEAVPEPVAQAEPEVPVEEQIRGLADEIARLLHRAEPDDAYRLAIRLAGLSAAQGRATAGLEGLIQSLAVDERDVVRALVGVLSNADSDPSALADIFERQAELLSESRPLRIAGAALCSRVEGYGRYTELGSTTFVAGSPMRMVVYTEVAHFNQSPVPGSLGGARGEEADRGPGWEVRLSQELQLFHEADGLLAWRQPEEVTAYRSRTRLRDFFLVNPIELPRTLTVGSYRLKIVMRDLGDGSVDERIIPISVVADPRLVTRSGG